MVSSHILAEQACLLNLKEVESLWDFQNRLGSCLSKLRERDEEDNPANEIMHERSEQQ